MTRRDARLVQSPLLGLPTMHEQAGALAPVPAVQARLSTLLLQRGQRADRWWQQHQVPMAVYRQAVAASARYTVNSCSARQQCQGEQREEAEDATQETFLRAYKTLATFDPARGSMAGWLSRIATHIALDLVHYRSPRPPMLSLDALSGVLAGQEAADPQSRYTGRQAHLAETLAQLPARSRRVLWLRYAGYTEAEIGAHVGKTARTVRTWLRQARVQLAHVREGAG